MRERRDASRDMRERREEANGWERRVCSGLGFHFYIYTLTF
jgi:hypothetical protein